MQSDIVRNVRVSLYVLLGAVALVWMVACVNLANLLLVRAVGRKRALQMLLTGESINAKTAADWGLINSVVPATELKTVTRKLASRIAEASPLTMSIGKQAYYTQIDLDQPKAYGYAKEVMTVNAMAGDAQEGISAFLDKRVACWSGK